MDDDATDSRKYSPSQSITSLITKAYGGSNILLWSNRIQHRGDSADRLELGVFASSRRHQLETIRKVKDATDEERLPHMRRRQIPPLSLSGAVSSMDRSITLHCDGLYRYSRRDSASPPRAIGTRRDIQKRRRDSASPPRGLTQ
ncbi:uncharacterized protein N7515_004530 [Penicillium bovifimosum]|uniref:Uncharacterized protein n=1 Tax=Penicillium bovifimosum TaxID=126998 RepID=A0A9W9H097_9EURO|nr:uncharacterized protein N7515_004530 [Penicillium bovifimosum]KAJ5135252.1 hypothetical protein N7515_004530 [Penicillium bovifimosum]